MQPRLYNYNRYDVSFAIVLCWRLRILGTARNPSRAMNALVGRTTKSSSDGGSRPRSRLARRYIKPAAESPPHAPFFRSPTSRLRLRPWPFSRNRLHQHHQYLVASVVDLSLPTPTQFNSKKKWTQHQQQQQSAAQAQHHPASRSLVESNIDVEIVVPRI